MDYEPDSFVAGLVRRMGIGPSETFADNAV